MKKLFFAIFSCIAASLTHAQTLIVDSFNSGANLGYVITGQPVTWVGQVTQNTNTITVGGSALDVNGWGNEDKPLNATGMSFLVITAQRDAGNAASNLVIAFNDQNFNTKIYSIPTSAFAIGSMTTVSVPVNFGSFDFANITDWSIGGGGTGSVAFHMTFDDLSFSAVTAVPEPSTYALMGLGLGVVGLSVRRRFRRA